MSTYLFRFFLVSMCLLSCKASKNSTKAIPQVEANVESINPSTLNVIPWDSTIVKDVLPNGLSYYIHQTDVVANVASYYLIQNVGSILETEEQRGLAHFLEHMAFNGTETFPEKTFLNKMEQQGLLFGRDINAYTSFDETVYNVDNVPSKSELIDTALQILKDWTNYLLLTEEEIDAERGVIREEWRTTRNSGSRIFDQTKEVVFGHSKYAQRLPIGLMEVVDSFDYQALKNFYYNWYRTDLQAIAIVGDVDVSDMEKRILQKFSEIPPAKNPPLRYEIEIPDIDSLEYVLATDKEVAIAQNTLSIRHSKAEDINSIDQLDKDLKYSMAIMLLNERLDELSQDPEASFVYVSVGFSEGTRKHKTFSIRAVPKENRQQEAFKAALTELQRALKFGFTKSELERAKTKINTRYENQIARLAERPHQAIIYQVKNNFLDGKDIRDVKAKAKVISKLMDEYNPVDLQESLNELYTKKNRSVVVVGVDGQNNMTRQEAMKIIEESENDTSMIAYEEEVLTGGLMEGIDFTEGSIKDSIIHTDPAYVTYLLSNGISVSYNYTDVSENSVILEARSNGGLSLLSEEAYPSSYILNYLVYYSGLSGYTEPQLSKVMTGKTANANISISETNEYVSGGSNSKDVDVLMQLVHLRFTNPRFDVDAYENLQQTLELQLKQRNESPNAKKRDSIICLLYGCDHPIKRSFSEEMVEEMSFEQAKNIYLERFANAADFHFFITGDVKPSVLKPILTKYLASIPTSTLKENWKDNFVDWNAKNIKKEIKIAMESKKASVDFKMEKDLPYSLKDSYVLRMLRGILDLRFTESLREDEGGTYGASVRSYFSRRPRSFANLRIQFDCDTAKVARMEAIVKDELEAIELGKIKEEDFNKVKNNLYKDRKDSKNKNSYYLSLMKRHVIDGYNLEAKANFGDILEEITLSDIQEMMQKLIRADRKYEFVFLPE